MPRTNKSHVVPQFYLRYFSNNPNTKPKKQRINVLQKQEAKILGNKLISDIGHIRRFYTLENDTDDTYEKKLAELEGKASTEYNKLVKSRDFTRCNPVTFLSFFALQTIRTGRTREDLLRHIKDAVTNANTTTQNQELLELAYPLVVTHKLNQIEILFNQESNKLSEKEKSIKITKILDKYRNIEQEVLKGNLSHLEQVGFYEDKEAMKLLHIQFLEGWQYFYKMLAADKEVRWILFRNQTHKPLVTSDNPVVVIPNLDAQINISNFLEQLKLFVGRKGFLPQTNIVPSKIFMYLPLTPFLGFIVLGKSIEGHFKKTYLGENTTRHDSFVEFLNGMQYIHSDQQLYSNTSFLMTSKTNDLLNALKNIDFALKEIP